VIESDLATYLIDDATETYAVAATRVYPTRKPPKALSPATYPMVTFFKVSGRVVHTHDAVDGLRMPTFQFNCWGRTYKDAHTLAEAVKADLDNFADAMGDTDHAVFLLEDEADISDPSLGVDTDNPHGVRLDFRVIHTPT
jgi:hypothetical protein